MRISDWSSDVCSSDLRFRLRIDDIDGSRSREAYVAAALADLAWLGIDRDGPLHRQSQHLGAYDAALGALKARGLVYPCFCTRADIAASLAAPHGPAGAVYPGTCRELESAHVRTPVPNALLVCRLLLATKKN